ncbi:hypothetical protein MRA01_63580 [Methylobacterium radiotolerans]|nr:hypothetical protein MRA01_63580 [Methylobacterium radiotolerans]
MLGRDLSRVPLVQEWLAGRLVVTRPASRIEIHWRLPHWPNGRLMTGRGFWSTIPQLSTDSVGHTLGISSGRKLR